ncbi:MAG: signal peptidase II [Aurantimonas coralicida]|jgi:signal peptidase II|uniref:signal peptidase II n=1 Tax=Aurantimonas coralicida TaxID=182270 RepID=UPI0004249D2D|nr:signal peptidase II [Aurantimonas coralicida]|tara:strand:- start:596 stop:1069 length:474 start_codon:yes stop_codon:yes gene_type:complete
MLKLGLPFTLLSFLLDQATKWWILNHVMDPPRVIPVTGFFNLVLGFNTGVSFGLFGEAPAWLLMAFILPMVAGLLVWMTRTDSRLTAIALGLVVGGAFGNLLDRLRHGAVTDFLDFYVGAYHWPAFNFADVAIVSGVALLLIESVLAREETKAATDA